MRGSNCEDRIGGRELPPKATHGGWLLGKCQSGGKARDRNGPIFEWDGAVCIGSATQSAVIFAQSAQFTISRKFGVERPATRGDCHQFLGNFTPMYEVCTEFMDGPNHFLLPRQEAGSSAAWIFASQRWPNLLKAAKQTRKRRRNLFRIGVPEL